MRADSSHLPLYGVFRELVSRNVPLGIREYLDALEALRLGFGMPREREDRPYARDHLAWLCRTLWARSEAERRLIDALINRLPPAAPEVEREIRKILEPGEAEGEATNSRAAQSRGASDGASAGATGVESAGSSSDEGSQARASIESGAGADGIGLPLLLPVAADTPETFVLDSQDLISPRSLAVLWRRLGTKVRVGPPVELDVDGTIRALTRRGVMAGAQMRPRLVSRAPVVILVDNSPSMAAWDPFVAALARSLEMSPLQSANLYYFSNCPRRLVFAKPDMTEAAELETVFRESPDASLLVVSDAGAARGFLNPRRVRRMRALVDRAARMLQTVVWVNPMPAPRWEGTSAGLLARHAKHATFLPLDKHSLIRAIDALRGIRRG